MSEYLIKLRVKHEPTVTELQNLRDRLKGWCDEFCLEKQELSIKTPLDMKAKKMREALDR